MPKKRSGARSADRGPKTEHDRDSAATASPPRAEPLTAEAWQLRKDFVGFTSRDEGILREMHLVARTYADEVMDELYRRWLAHDEVRAFFPDEATVQRVKALQKTYFLGLTSGTYGLEYAENRLHIGRVHRRIGLSPRWYLGAYSIYLQLVLPRLLAAFEYNRSKATLAVNALVKIVLLDQELALLAYGDQGGPATA